MSAETHDELAPRVRHALGDDDREHVAPVARQRVADLHGRGQPFGPLGQEPSDVLARVPATAPVQDDAAAVDPGALQGTAKLFRAFGEDYREKKL